MALSDGQTLLAVLEDLLEIIKNHNTASEQIIKGNTREESRQDDPGPTEPMTALPEILTAQDIADYLIISRRRVYELLDLIPKAGGIPSFNIGSSRRVEKEDFKEWVKKQKGHPKTKKGRFS